MLSIGNVWTFHAVLLFSHDRDWTCRRKGRKMHGKKSSLFSNADLSIGSLESIHVKRIYNGIKAKRHLSCWWQVKDSAETGYEYNMQAFKKPSRRWTFIVVAQAALFFSCIFNHERQWTNWCTYRWRWAFPPQRWVPSLFLLARCFHLTWTVLLQLLFKSSSTKWCRATSHALKKLAMCW